MAPCRVGDQRIRPIEVIPEAASLGTRLFGVEPLAEDSRSPHGLLLRHAVRTEVSISRVLFGSVRSPVQIRASRLRNLSVRYGRGSCIFRKGRRC
jgi:hypothetical protein